MKRGILTKFAATAGVTPGFASLLLSGKKRAGYGLCMRLAELTETDACLWSFGPAADREAAVVIWARRNEIEMKGGRHNDTE